MKIEFSPPVITRGDLACVENCLHSKWLTTGKITEQFENDFAKVVNSKHALAVSSCTAALHLSLLVHNVKPGDKIIVTPNTFVSAINVIIQCGAIPVFASLDTDTLNMALDNLEILIDEQTIGIMATHYGGIPLDLKKLNDIAKRNNLFVIEDAAHALGSKIGEKIIGNSENLVCFSFYPTKVITTIEGGMITTNTDKYIERLKRLRLHGLTTNAWARYKSNPNRMYDVEEPGYKYNLPDIHSAIGISQLSRLDKILKRRLALSENYEKQLKNLDIKFQSLPDFCQKNGYLFPILLASRETRIALGDYLHSRGIQTSVLFHSILTLDYYKKFDTKKENNSLELCEKILCLPLSMCLSDSQQAYIIDAIKEFFTKKGLSQ